MDTPTSSEGFFTEGRQSLYSWSENANDYKIVAELIPLCRDTGQALSILSGINKLLPEDKKFIFDGTISSLRFLVDNKQLDISKITNPILKKIVDKHLNNPQESNKIQVNANRWSGQALRCKAVLIGLYLYSRKLQVTSNSTHMIRLFETLNENNFPVLDSDVKEGRLSEDSIGKMTQINAMWVGLASMTPWSVGKEMDIAEFALERFMNSFIEDTFMYGLFTIFQPYIDQVAEKYFPSFHSKDHRACTAIRHASVIVLYKLADNLPKEAVRNPKVRVDGFLDKWVEYIFTQDGKLEDWFIHYLQKELEPRIKFIKLLIDEDIFFEPEEKAKEFLDSNLFDKSRGKNEALYLPVYDGFRFFPQGMIPMIKKLVKIFQNKNVGILEKDKIAQAIIINLQKLIVYKSEATFAKDDPTFNRFILQEDYLREAFNLLMLHILLPLAKSTFRQYASKIENYKEQKSDLAQIITTELLTSILKFDRSKNSSFFGYIHKVLPLYVISGMRKRKSDNKSSSLEEILEKTPEKLLEESKVEEVAIENEIKAKINQCINTLPKKEKEAIIKAFHRNDSLTDTERKAKNRGIQKLRLNYPELKALL